MPSFSVSPNSSRFAPHVKTEGPAIGSCSSHRWAELPALRLKFAEFRLISRKPIEDHSHGLLQRVPAERNTSPAASYVKSDLAKWDQALAGSNCAHRVSITGCVIPRRRRKRLQSGSPSLRHTNQTAASLTVQLAHRTRFFLDSPCTISRLWPNPSRICNLVFGVHLSSV